MSTNLVALQNLCGTEALGSVGAIFGIEKSEIDSYQLATDGTIDAITLATGATFVKFGFVDDKAQAVAEPQENDQGMTTGFQNTLTFNSYGLNAAKRKALEDARICSMCGLVIYWRDAGGQWNIGGLGGDRPDPSVAAVYDPENETGQVYLGYKTDSGEGISSNFMVDKTLKWKTRFHYRQWAGGTLPTGVS